MKIMQLYSDEFKILYKAAIFKYKIFDNLHTMNEC